MPREIETYKTVMINNKFGNNQNSFNKSIYVEFIPDEIVLKFISAQDNNANDEEGSYLLRTNLVEPFDLISFPASSGYAESVDIPFRSTKPINSNYEFNLSKVDGGAIARLTTMNLSVSLTFLFIKFKSV